MYDFKNSCDAGVKTAMIDTSPSFCILLGARCVLSPLSLNEAGAYSVRSCGEDIDIEKTALSAIPAERVHPPHEVNFPIYDRLVPPCLSSMPQNERSAMVSGTGFMRSSMLSPTRYTSVLVDGWSRSTSLCFLNRWLRGASGSSDSPRGTYRMIREMRPFG